MPYKILIVDNAPYARKLLRTKFEEHGHTVIGEAENVKEAIEYYWKFKPDLVSMDMMLTAESGIDGIRALIKLDPNARIIVISAMADKDTISRALSYGAKSYSTKASDWHSIEEAIRQAFLPPKETT